MTDFFTEKQKMDLEYFYNKLPEYLADALYKHKFVLINNKNIDGVFDTFENAITSAASKFQPGEYIIQQIISDTEVTEFIYPAYV